MRHIRIMVFPGAHNLPLWLMKGVEMHYTESRDQQIKEIQDHKVDVIHTSPDNLFLSDAKGLVPFLSGTVGPLEIVVTNTETSQVLAVDNPHSGFGRLAYRWLRQHHPEMDYDILPVGGTRQRFEALKQSTATMAVMHPPFTQFCVKAGYQILGRIDKGYPTLCGVCREPQRGTDWVHTYQNEYSRALRTLASLDGKGVARQVLAQELPDVPAEVRNHIADVMRQETIAAGVEFDFGAMNKLKEL